MDDGRFQWDDQKAAANHAKHRVTFDAARDVFKDSFALDWLDESERYDEPRYAVIGMVGPRLLYVAYTMRSDAIRIISAP
jgi:uncharacterized protein